MNSLETKILIQKFNEGALLIHPTDTIPGMSYSLLSPDPVCKLNSIKKRDLQKPILGLVANPNEALDLWDDVPLSVVSILRRSWPPYTTIVYKAKKSLECVKKMLNTNQEIALRVPAPSEDNLELLSFLNLLGGVPLLSTSLNFEGESPCQGEFDFEAFTSQLAADYLVLPIKWESVKNVASTIIRIKEDATFETIRKGFEYENVRSILGLSEPIP